MNLSVTDSPGAEAHQTILGGLVASNELRFGPSHWRPLAVLLHDDQGKIVGGLWAGTAFDWLQIELLFVPEPMRTRGTGARMLALAEEEALARGCRGAWLDTFGFQARPFYERRGYRVVGRIDDHPRGSARYFMSKDFERA
ncbi:MAG TPA: GNAT family N-acetyltransferase [Caulobacteraceae bacterium]